MSNKAMKLALNKAFQLGQRYWSWADSEYSSHWKKADAAKAEFDQLVQDTVNAALAEQPAQQEPVAAVIRNSAGQIALMKPDGNAFDVSKYIGHSFYTSPTAQQQDGETITQMFTGLPKRKLNELLAAGWQINGVCLQRTEEDGTVRRGAVTTGGMVLWWNQPAQQEHITDGSRCWCNPDLDYKDPDTGAEVWIHKEPK